MRTIIILFIMFYPFCFASATTAGKIKAGNKQFKKGAFDKSLEKYREAEISDPDNPVVHYNMGNSLYKMEKYDESSNEYNKSVSSQNKELKARSLYNLGNSAYRQGKFDEALDYYKKSLEINPDDEDAKFNYEYTKNHKFNMSKNNQNKNDKQKKQDKDKPKQNEQNKDSDNKDKEKQKQQQEDKEKMSKEDAQRILQYFDESDRNSAEKRKMKIPQLPKVDEDW